MLRRPTTTTKLGQWRKLTTLFYSSLFATAAAADVQVKQSRREQWDSAIATAEEQVQEGRRRHLNEDNKIAGLADIAAGQLRPFDESAQLPQRLSAALRSVGASAIPVPHGLQRRDPGRESMYASDYVRRNESTWTPKKLAIAELAMAKLALRFSMAVPNIEQRESLVDGSCLYLKPMLEEVVRKLESVKHQDTFQSDPTNRPGLPQYTPGERAGSPTFHNRPLYTTLSKLAGKYKQGKLELPSFLTSISQNLLATRSPPDVASMTVILNILSQHQEYNLADAVCTSIMESNLRLDEICVDAMVNHYTAANDSKGFNYFVRKIHGYHGGLALARNIHITRQSAKRLRKWKDKVIQGIEMDSILSHSVIRGQLYFGQIPDAVKTFYDTIEAGFKVHHKALSAFIQMATLVKDWQLGMSFWNLVKPWSADWIVLEGSHRASAFAHMLELCKVREQQDQYDVISHEARIFGLDPEALTGEALPKMQPLSQRTEIFRRHVRILRRKAELENIRFQRRARLVFGTQLRLSGFSRPAIIDLFDEAAKIERTQMASKAEHSAYLRRLTQARRILNAHGPWQRRKEVRAESAEMPESLAQEHPIPIASRQLQSGDDEQPTGTASHTTKRVPADHRQIGRGSPGDTSIEARPLPGRSLQRYHVPAVPLTHWHQTDSSYELAAASG